MYPFICEHRHEHRFRILCLVFQVNRVGIYAWLHKPLYDQALPIVMVLCVRNIVGWSMKPTLAWNIVPGALIMAAWRRKPK